MDITDINRNAAPKNAVRNTIVDHKCILFFPAQTSSNTGWQIIIMTHALDFDMIVR